MKRRENQVRKIKVGDPFEMLTVATLPEYGIGRSGKRYLMCWCDCRCGKRVQVIAGNLTRGNSKSCGCVWSSVTSERNRSHSFSGTRIYQTWAGMIKRCENPKARSFKDYGARGISVCDQWRRDFEAFFDWAMVNGYKHDLTIERDDNNLGYSPENCRWLPQPEQAANKRNSNIFEAFGETKHLAAWARDPRCKVDLQCLGCRIRRGMNPEKALTAPERTGKRVYLEPRSS